jgi:uncharacterized membrane protein
MSTASTVEFVEALTIVLAVGVVRGWGDHSFAVFLAHRAASAPSAG